jgi:hypothetical protein
MLEKRPLVCYTDVDGKYVVLGGNMRLKAAQEVGLKEMPIILADDWTQEQKDEFLIKDNVGFGEWNWDELANEWDVEELEAWGLDIPQFTDYSDKNQEIDVDDYTDKMIIKLEYTENDYLQVRDQLSKIADTPEQAVWKLLGNE